MTLSAIFDHLRTNVSGEIPNLKDSSFNIGQTGPALPKDVEYAILESGSTVIDITEKIKCKLVGDFDTNSCLDIVKRAYQKYKSMPKSMSEWISIGKPQGGWNGISTMIESIIKTGNGAEIEFQLCPNKLLQAEKDCRAQDNDHKWGPKQAHVGLLAPTMIDGKLYLIGQLRGSWVDKGGSLHPCLTAGGIEEKHFESEDPNAAALKMETIEEFCPLGSRWRSSKPLYLLTEDGDLDKALYCNFQHTLKKNDGTAITFDEYKEMMQNYSKTFAEKNSNEVKGWALIPIDNPDFEMKDGKIFIKNITGFETNSEGGITEKHIGSIEGFSIGAFSIFLQLSDEDSPIRHKLLKESGLIL